MDLMLDAKENGTFMLEWIFPLLMSKNIARLLLDLHLMVGIFFILILDRILELN